MSQIEPQDDAALLDAFVRGDRRGLARLAERHERGLLGLARGLLGGRADLACDAVQESWVRVIRFAAKFERRSSVKTWLYRIVVNQCRAMRQSERAAESAESVAEAAAADESRKAAAGGSPAGALEQDESLGELRRHVEALDCDRREVLLLCYHAGMTHEQAAGVLGLPLGTLKSRLHAALNELRERLAQETQR